MTEKPTIYSVNCQTVAEDITVPAFLRLLAKNILDTGYVSIGKFYESLADFEIEHLLSEFEYLNDENLEVDETEDVIPGQDIVLLTMMLCQADGSIDMTEMPIFDKYLDITANFCILESLYRSGLIEVNRNNYSYSDDTLVVASKK